MQSAEVTATVKATAESVRNARTETIFYLTLFVTLVEAGFIFWDLFAMLPGAGGLFGFAGENTVYASGTLSTVYLALLGIYAGVKEFTRWTAGAQAEVPEEKARQFRRGEVIVAFWIILLVVAAALESMHLVSRLPHELFRVAMQALAVMTGTLASRSVYSSKRGRAAEEAGLKGQFSGKIAECLAQQGYVDNELCQQITGLPRYSALRLLKTLEADGMLKRDGKGRAVRYIKPV